MVESKLNKILKTPFLKVVLNNKKEKAFFFSLIFLLNIAAALLEGISFSFIILAITALGDNINISNLPTFLAKFQKLHNWDSTSLFSFFIILAISLQLLRSSLSYFGQISAIHISTKIQLDLQRKIYKQIFGLNYSCVSKYKTGDLIEYVSSPAVMVPGLADAINQSLVSFFSCCVLAFLLFFISIKMTLVVLGSFVVVFFIQKKVVLKISNISKKLTSLQIELSKKTVQHLQALKLIYTYNRRQESLKNTNDNIVNIRNVTKKLCTFTSLLTPFNEVISIILVGVCLAVGPFFLKTNMVPVLLTFLTITYRLSTRAQIFSTNVGVAAKHVGFIHRMNEILKSEDKEFVRETGDAINEFKNKIEFKDINFKYSKKLACALNKVSFEIAKGETVAFVGPSGSGKSTVLDLLTCLYEPNAGQILVDGKGLDQLNIQSWRELLGVVSQDSFIFHGTIEENIRFGKLDADMDEIVKASKTAGALEFILNLPGGFQTVVGERGHRLSGGERQRLALARALVRNPQILILDEATSNLDSHSEYFIQQALERLQHKITIVVVAHRLSTITKSDQIFLIDDGQISENGTHEELITLKRKYCSFWEIQSKGKLCVES